MDKPEKFGFQYNQVTPFSISSRDTGELYAWHILPINTYREHEEELLNDASGFSSDIETRASFNLLSNDRDAWLVIYLHGVAGTVGSGRRAPSYRVLSAGQSNDPHILVFDYRGFGRSSGIPCEHGLILDGVYVVEWALTVAKTPPSRIVIFGHSLGAAVNAGIAEHYAQREPPIIFAGHVLVAPFIDTTTLVSTYRIAGYIPVLSPLHIFPALFDFFSSFIQDKWSTEERISSYVRLNMSLGLGFILTIIHARDDSIVPWQHTSNIFWSALSAAYSSRNAFEEPGIARQELKSIVEDDKIVTEWAKDHSLIRRVILEQGQHSSIVTRASVSQAVSDIVQ